MRSEEQASGRVPHNSDAEALQPQRAPRGLLHFYAVLSIARKPMSGYDLIKEIEVKTKGAWRPGPGAVYPVLQKLVKQGYISAKKKSKEGPTEIHYEITTSGLDHIAKAKKMMRTSTERMSLMSSLFLDLMESDDLVSVVLNSFDMQAQLVRTVVESDKSKLSNQDKLFVLRQYRLNLERELGRAITSVESVENRTGPESTVGRRPTRDRGAG